jgi:very-short-patch-repair endonuclease
MMNPERRITQIKAFHDKIRGSHKTHAMLVERAKGVQRVAKQSSIEIMFHELFKAADTPVIPQYAIDIFNVDFAIPEAKLAIEVSTGGFHNTPPKRFHDERMKAYLESIGWTVLAFNNFRRYKPQEAIAFVEIVSTHPALRGKNGMITRQP